MRISDRSLLVRPLLIFGALFLISQAEQSVAQVENAAVAGIESTSSPIRVVAGQVPVSTPQTDQFMQALDQAIEITSKRTLTANAHSPWQIFHCILALRRETVLRLGSEKVNAIQWLSTAEPQFDNQPWLLLTPHGAKFHSYTRLYAFEGHPSQFLALLSHSNLPLDYEFHVQGKVVTLNDLVNNTMKEVNMAEEVTWVLWALQHFLKPDAVWTNQANETWSIERLVQIESNAPVVGTPCGGNHRLFALTRARDKYLQNGGKLRGVWYQADQKIKQHIEIARSLQNADGSFSSDWYKGPNHTTDVNPRFNTTGHTMEFLSISLPNERLNEPWVRNAVWTLSRELIHHRDTKIDCGPLFHSLDALILYRDRIRPRAPEPDLAKQPTPAISISKSTLRPEVDLKSGNDSKLKAQPEKPLRKPEMVTKLPATIKLDASETAPVAPPISETTENSEKAVPPKSESPAVTVPQASLPMVSGPAMAGSNSHASPLKSTKQIVPQIDPSKLPNIGQVATAPKSTDPKSDSERFTREGLLILPPALLPDLAGTPLPLRESPVLKLHLQPGALVSESKATADDLDQVMPDGDVTVPLSSIVDEDIEQEQPASALEPANL